MKKLIPVLLVACMLLSGCNFWMDGSYHSVTPHPPERVDAKQDSVTLESLDALSEALIGLVEQGSASTVIYCPSADVQALEAAMASAIQNLSKNNGIFAYAVDDMLYEAGQRNSQTAVSVQISYLHEKQELQKILHAEQMQEAFDLIGTALDGCEAGVLLRVRQYEDMDVTQFVQDYVDANPQSCMELPQVNVQLYPQTGPDRVMEITFAYQTSREALRNMQEVVQPVFSSAKNYVNADGDHMEKYSQLYSFLMGRDTYTVRTSLTPSYSLLNHAVGDSKAFAVVYAAMCRQLELDCRVVSGTRDGEPWCWNVLKEGGTVYHLDLLQCSQNGGFQVMEDRTMENYVWDYSAY